MLQGERVRDCSLVHRLRVQRKEEEKEDKKWGKGAKDACQGARVTGRVLSLSLCLPPSRRCSCCRSSHMHVSVCAWKQLGFP